MSGANALRASSPAKRLTPQIVLMAWRGITGRQIWTTFLLGCALFVYQLGAMGGTTGSLLGDGFIVIGDQFTAFALLLVLVVADHLTGKDARRRGAYALAVVVGSAAGVLPVMVFIGIVFPLFVRPEPFRIGFTLYVFLDLVMVAGGTVWAINDRRRARLSRARTHSAQLERINAEKRSIESDLQAMQARVEPQFLFNTLAQVKRLYEQDSALGERMLDELIAYLRAAMPKMRDTSSTLGQELELVRAYLAIVKVRLGDRLTYEIESAPALADVRIPPMLLLPLVDHAIAQGLAEPRSTGSIRIRTTIAADKVLLEITDTGVGFLPESEGDDIAGIRERLAALYEANASLVLQKGEGTMEAVLEFPFEGRSQRADAFVFVDAPAPSSSAAQSGIAGT